MVNQCDGCRTGMPRVIANGVLSHPIPMHLDSRGVARMICCSDMYDDEKHVVCTTNSGEHGPAVLSEN